MNRCICILCSLLAINSWQWSVLAQTAPRLIPFQGRLTDQAGTFVSNGVRLVQFKIFDVPNGGSPSWAGEIHRTTVNGGLVNVLLGSKTPFTGVDFDRQLYLEITVDINSDNAITAADPPMLPRQAILPVVFAKEAANSRKLAGEDWSPIFGVNSPNGPIPGSKLSEGSLPSSKLAAEVIDRLVPPGSIIAFGGSNAPSGWLKCDGNVVRATDYPGLFAAIGVAWGAGTNATSFHLPDLRGRFLRGVDDNSGRDPDAGARTNANAGGNSGAGIGSVQQDELITHNHTISQWKYRQWFNPSTGIYGMLLNFPDGNPAITDYAGGQETRPKNAYVNYIIKY